MSKDCTARPSLVILTAGWLITTWQSSFSKRGKLPRRSRISSRPCGSIPRAPRPTETWASPCSTATPTPHESTSRRRVQFKPNYFKAHNDLADALVQAGRPQEAIEQYRQALKINPDFAEAHNGLGRTLAAQGHVNEAIPHFEQALQLNPDLDEAYMNLTLAYAKIGRSTEAIATAQRALTVARAKGQAELAAQIQAWVSQYRNDLFNRQLVPSRSN